MAQAHDVLTAALQDQATWEQRRRSAKELLNEMLASRREAAELAKSFDTRCAPTLPRIVVGRPRCAAAAHLATAVCGVPGCQHEGGLSSPSSDHGVAHLLTL